jgi:hypothetical protein
MPNGLAHFVIDGFVLLQQVVGDCGRIRRIWRRPGRGGIGRIGRRRSTRSGNSPNPLDFRLSLFLLLLAADHASLGIVVLDSFFDLLEVHHHGNLRTHLARTDCRFQDLDDFARKFRFELLPQVQLLSG